MARIRQIYAFWTTVAGVFMPVMWSPDAELLREMGRVLGKTGVVLRVEGCNTLGCDIGRTG